MSTNKLITLDYNKKNLYILILSIVWIFSFRSSIPKIFENMDIYESIKYDVDIILFKNFSGILFFICYFIEIQKSKYRKKYAIKLIEKKTNGKLIIESEKYFSRRNTLEDMRKKKAHFIIILLKIIFTYIIEEFYFIIDNNHVYNREIISFKNLILFISLFLFSRLLLKNSFSIYIHQIIPMLVIVIGNLVAIMIFLIYFNLDSKTQFDIIKIIGYLSLYLSLGLEFIEEKNIIDFYCINIFFIMGIKSIFGVLVFLIIKFFFNRKRIIYVDTVKIPILQKILYIFSILFLELFKLIVNQHFGPFHIFSAMILGELIYFFYYIIERTYFYNLEIKYLFFNCMQAGFALISFFLTLIFTETIIFGFCGLNVNTRKYIRKRSDSEIEKIENNNEDSDYLSSYTDNSTLTIVKNL